MKHATDCCWTKSADLNAERRTEWLVTNGCGGYAMATPCQMLTRRYHGLLVAAVDPPVERSVLLAKLEAVLAVDGQKFELATNDFPGAVYPSGHTSLEAFSLRPCPTWRWRVGSAVVEQMLCMSPGEDTTYIRYRLIEGLASVGITIRPLCTNRHFHHLTRRGDMSAPSVVFDNEAVTIRWADGQPSLFLSHNGRFQPNSDWYYNFELATERARGFDYAQDLFMPGEFNALLKKGDTAGFIVAASTQRRSWRQHVGAFGIAADEVFPKVAGKASEDALVAALVRATKDFIVDRGSGKTIIAGYPWFADWGRDTFISLPGLCLTTGRFDEAKKMIAAFAPYVDEGMVPNRFPDFGEVPDYNSVDASLWYVHALDRYLAYSGDWRFLEQQMFAVVCKILTAYEKGTRYGIRVCLDGLLAAGESGTNLTWMDARIGVRSITPRVGKPVEINALWYNALQIAVRFAERCKDETKARHWRDLAARCRKSFNDRFWNESAKALYDVVDDDGNAGQNDDSIRPNMLFAVSLTYPVLDESKFAAVVDICERELMTPLGPRSLAPNQPRYSGRYEGDPVTRDSVYHQGTVWPWLLGPFVTAYVRAHGRSAATLQKVRSFFAGIEVHLHEAGLGSVSEVANGDAPHTPGGCPWQAWSVAEPLRALCEDVYGLAPASEVATKSMTKEAMTSAAPAGVTERKPHERV